MEVSKKIIYKTRTNEGLIGHVITLLIEDESDPLCQAVIITKRCFARMENDIPEQLIIRRFKNNIVLIEESISLKPATVQMIACEL